MPPALTLLADLAVVLALFFGLTGIGRLLMRLTVSFDEPEMFFIPACLGILIFSLTIFTLGPQEHTYCRFNSVAKRP